MSATSGLTESPSLPSSPQLQPFTFFPDTLDQNRVVGLVARPREKKTFAKPRPGRSYCDKRPPPFARASMAD